VDIWEERESGSDEGKDGLGDEPFAGRHLARRASKLKSSTSNDLAARLPLISRSRTKHFSIRAMPAETLFREHRAEPSAAPPPGGSKKR